MLIDSSAWIDFFNLEESRIAEEVQTLIEEDRAVITGPVFVEVAIGVGSEKELGRWRDTYSDLRKVEADEAAWLKTAENGYRLRRKGIAVPAIDLLLATLAKAKGLSILHSGDKHFPMLAVPLGVNEYSPADND